MKLTAVIMFAACLQISARGHSQGVTLSMKDAPLQKVFKEIKKQTGYLFLYTGEVMDKAHPVSIEVRNAPLDEVLQQCFLDQPLSYAIVEKTVVIEPAAPVVPLTIAPSPPPVLTLHGKVENERGAFLPGAIIHIKDSNQGAVTDDHGEFTLVDVATNATLLITNIGYETQEIKLHGQETLHITLKVKSNPLDQVQVIAYGTTTQRLATGNVTTITSKEIEKQPVSNPLLALEGRVPGLFIAQNNGNPGTAVSVQLQGQNSINQGSNPLYVIDGVPYPSELLPDNLMGSILGYAGYNGSPSGPGSPLSFINPSDIESISVLKDADATSIYGSQAANGAIIITTKRGVEGPTKVDINAQTGWGQVSRTMDMMNTRQYIEMRKEAINNNGSTISAGDVDINGIWDTTRNTNWQKVLLGGTAKYTNINVAISGGTATNQFLLGATYNRQTTVFPNPKNYADQKGDVHFSMNNISTNQKFRVQLTGTYMIDNNLLPTQDETNNALRYAPDAPPLYNKDGSINWGPDSLSNDVSTNPIAYVLNTYQNKTYNLIGNAIISYELLPGLDVKSSFGYNDLKTNELMEYPLSGLPPSQQAFATPFAEYGNEDINSWIIEPQATYKRAIGKTGTLNALVGMTFEQRNSNGSQVSAAGFTSDAELNDINAAATLAVSLNGSTNSVYNYDALFGRLNYNLNDKYIIDLTARRDGSSRFGSDNLFHNFYSAAGAWIFSSEGFIKNSLPFLSFGKLRASYGTTGNDQIGDYTFMTLYSAGINYGAPYQGQVGLQPNGLPNPYLQWEDTRKLQFGLDLGFVKDRILLNANYAVNRSSNQLVYYLLPRIVGFYGVNANLLATVQNTDWELTLNTLNVNSRDFRWSTSFNLTIPQNKLIAYPGLSTSPYSYSYKIGQPLNISFLYHFVGVNDTTGIYEFATAKGGTTYNPSYEVDNTVVVKKDPQFYGGIENTFSYKGFELSFFLQFTKQLGQNYEYAGAGFDPGTWQGGFNNQPTIVLDRWQKPGDKKPIQKYDANYSIINQEFDVAAFSDAAYTDASYIRLKNLSLSWQLPAPWRKTAHLQNARLYVQGENLFILTHYVGMDPENGSVSALPPLKVLTVGMQVVL